jgi:hypothetical protein
MFLNIHYFPSQYFFDLEAISFEDFNISENNIISVKLAKVLRVLNTVAFIWSHIFKNNHSPFSIGPTLAGTFIH